LANDGRRLVRLVLGCTSIARRPFGSTSQKSRSVRLRRPSRLFSGRHIHRHDTGTGRHRSAPCRASVGLDDRGSWRTGEGCLIRTGRTGLLLAEVQQSTQAQVVGTLRLQPATERLVRGLQSADWRGPEHRRDILLRSCASTISLMQGIGEPWEPWTLRSASSVDVGVSFARRCVEAERACPGQGSAHGFGSGIHRCAQVVCITRQLKSTQPSAVPCLVPPMVLSRYAVTERVVHR
jgi:hypothetical protein